MADYEWRLGKPSPLLPRPHHDGATYNPVVDKVRLNNQTQLVLDLMFDGRWRTLSEIASATGAPEASVSARLRDLRKPKFGSWIVERHRLSPGLHEYRLVFNK